MVDIHHYSLESYVPFTALNRVPILRFDLGAGQGEFCPRPLAGLLIAIGDPRIQRRIWKGRSWPLTTPKLSMKSVGSATRYVKASWYTGP